MKQKNLCNLDFIRKMNDLLDKAMTPAQERSFLAEIKDNPEYNSILLREKAFRDFLKTRLQRKPVNTALKEAILSKIKSSNL
ncbi:MAG: hypothetical protein D6714_18585 [Bacteroidetes bacterium]|nr:MAG: hypothetical protein D6714_18585 [Bacteroidota bacterium]